MIIKSLLTPWTVSSNWIGLEHPLNVSQLQLTTLYVFAESALHSSQIWMNVFNGRIRLLWLRRGLSWCERGEDWVSGKGSVNPLFLSICSGVSFGEIDTFWDRQATKSPQFFGWLKTASSNQISIDWFVARSNPPFGDKRLVTVLPPLSVCNTRVDEVGKEKCSLFPCFVI